MPEIFLGIVIGCLLWHLLHKAFLHWQLKELKRMSGELLDKSVYCNPGKLGKRFKYLHNFLVETRIHFGLQLRNLKIDLMKLCLKYDILGFKSTPLGKCLQSRIDAETKVFGSSLTLFHPSPLSQFKDYLYGITHPDPVIYGDKG